MRATDLRVGMLVSGVAITSITRTNALRRITLADGTTRVEHQMQAIADVSVSLAGMPAGPVPCKPINNVSKVRASSKDWRGESDGRKGERFIARNDAWDRRAVEEM